MLNVRAEGHAELGDKRNAKPVLESFGVVSNVNAKPKQESCRSTCRSKCKKASELRT